MDRCDLAQEMFLELRKEILEFQKLRAQIIGFKITFVGTGIALILRDMQSFSELLAIPALSAFFFDILITSYTYRGKTHGLYIRTFLEPILKKEAKWPRGVPLWEEFLFKNPWTTPKSFMVGNLGLTLLVTVGAIMYLFLAPAQSGAILSQSGAIVLMVMLVSAGVLDVYSFLAPDILFKKQLDVGRYDEGILSEEVAQRGKTGAEMES